MRKHENLFRLLLVEHLVRGMTAGLGAMAVAAALASLLWSLASFYEFTPPRYYLIAALGVMLSAGILGFVFGRGSRRQMAVEIDRRAATGNRLESAVLLAGSDHPLRDAQLRECIIYFRAHPLPWRAYRMLPAACLLALLVLPLALVHPYVKPQTQTAQSGATAKPTEKKAAAEEAENPELTLTAPESEMRAKPMDEIGFEGSAASAAGFTEITLKLYVNAIWKKDIKINSRELAKGGKVTFNGDFCLDELAVNPFDLVSYHLEGYTVRDAERRRPVVSTPQFIEVRPFREDAFMMKGGRSSRPVSVIEKLLQAQIELNKSTFLARSALGRVNGQILAREVNNVALGQGDVYLELTEFINTIDPKDIPANAFYAVKQAAENMHRARTQLDQLTKQLRSASPLEAEEAKP